MLLKLIPSPLDAFAANIVFKSEIDPVKLLTVSASIFPVVLLFKVVKADISVTLVSLRVIASFPKLLMPSPVAADAVYAVFKSVINPVKVVTVSAFIVPVVLPFKVFNTDAARVVSLRVMLSVPNPVNVDV